MDTTIRLYGQLDGWPSKLEMAKLLKVAGLSVHVGEYSIRILNCEHFVFQEYGGDLGDPQFDADASTLARMIEDGQRVSAALTAAGIRHRFELYNESDEVVECMNHEWPSQMR